MCHSHAPRLFEHFGLHTPSLLYSSGARGSLLTFWGNASNPLRHLCKKKRRRRISTVRAIFFLLPFCFLLNDSITCLFFSLTEDLKRMMILGNP